MNFIDGMLARGDKGFVVQAAGAADLPVSVDVTAAKPGQPVTLGIRPEHLQISDARESRRKSRWSNGSAMSASLI